MTGAGFGGCTVSLVKSDEVESVARALAEGYQQKTGITPTMFVSRPAQVPSSCRSMARAMARTAGGSVGYSARAMRVQMSEATAAVAGKGVHPTPCLSPPQTCGSCCGKVACLQTSS